MVTESTNTVYACAACGQPARLGKWDTWEHYSRTSRCSSLTVVAVRLPIPVPRAEAS
ncbi:hypothetical protein SEA_ODYSSEY395_118 [Arthrobacter phage Odyssey395]|nr:hypothetical protein SEA_ODYSSEY395_118 [Arthrobacter phage Odyssey395]